MVDAATIRDRLSYDPATGEFRWLNGARCGEIAGSLDAQGYRILSFGPGARCKAHRAAWLLVYGRQPQGVIDHINGDRADNRIVNLRDVDHAGNRQNQTTARSDSKTGLVGVRLYKQRQHVFYRAVVTVAGKRTWSGRHFRTPEEAHAAYLQLKQRLLPAMEG
jgi:hypothetical protein